VKRAFDLNGYVGIVYFVVTALSLYLSWPRRTQRRWSPRRSRRPRRKQITKTFIFLCVLRFVSFVFFVVHAVFVAW